MRKDRPRATTSLPEGGGRGRLITSFAPQGKHQDIFLLVVPPGRQSGGNTSNPSSKCGQWPTAFPWSGAGACTLRTKLTFGGSDPSACCHSRCCSPTEGDLRSLSQEARESHPTMSTWTTSGYNPWRSKLRRKVLTLRRQLRRCTRR